MIFAGVKHFTDTEVFMSIMPTWIPVEYHAMCVWVSGVCEILGGIGMLFPLRIVRSLAAMGAYEECV